MDTTRTAEAEGSRPVNFMSWFFPLFWIVFLFYPLSAAWSLEGSARFWGLTLTVVFAAVFYTAMVVGGVGLGAFSRSVRDARHRGRARQGEESPSTLAIVIMVVITVMVAVPARRGGGAGLPRLHLRPRRGVGAEA
jgi:two-component system sensor histidine kinase DesK